MRKRDTCVCVVICESVAALIKSIENAVSAVAFGKLHILFVFCYAVKVSPDFEHTALLALIDGVG